jgi:hypothetical protein
MGDRRKWMPVLRMKVGKRPSDARKGNTARYFRIFIDVFLIIVVYEVVTEGPTEDDPGDCCEKNAESDT